ncbi:hypothetical protein BDN72DRAFT_851318 [Pluteus cervinus]|uniref:Uncharacterized protein n=1 Tax=Pluteus cervinus TaxID=181527 RepID=A0ACD3A191_9AGAR|nr:hypothetical protein BDN72DRAFT_851318 [Pluteus cervinus]
MMSWGAILRAVAPVYAVLFEGHMVGISTDFFSGDRCAWLKQTERKEGIISAYAAACNVLGAMDVNIHSFMRMAIWSSVGLRELRPER